MRKQIVILGGGTGGTMTANRLRRRLDENEAEIHVVDLRSRWKAAPVRRDGVESVGERFLGAPRQVRVDDRTVNK